MREINLNRQKLGLEDLLFGVGIVTQIRAGQNVEVTRLNAGNLPFDETRTLLEWVQSINLEALGSMTTELQAIYDNLSTIGNVEDNLTVINTLEDNLVALQSLYTNISKLQNIDTNMSKLQNIDTNMSKLQNIDTNMSKLQNIDTNMSKLQAIYTDLTKLESIYDNLTMLLAIYNNLTVLNNINSQVIPNLTELLLVNDNAIQVAADKVTVSTDKGIVAGYKDDVSAMKLAVESIYDTFDDRFLGVKINNPTIDNDGNALLDGAMYFNTLSNALKVYSLDNTTWYTIPQLYLSGLLDVTLTSITTGDILTWNGTKWVNTTIDIKLDLHGRAAKTTPVDADEIMIADSASTFSLKKITWANIKTVLTSLFAPISNPTFTGNVSLPNTTSIGQVSSTELCYLDGVTSAIQTQFGNKAATNQTMYVGTTALAINRTSAAQTLTGISIDGSSGSCTGNAATATKLTNSSGDWTGSGAGLNVVGMLSWKNYGNNHVIFDASNYTAPNGTAISNANPQNGWGPTYPTLMGWDGVQTYGVRVDAARYSESCTGNAATSTYAQAFTTAVGSAPSYACRAWVNFNGTGTVAIRASGNVSSITDNGVGNYTVNFTTAMPDTNYSIAGIASIAGYSGVYSPLVLTEGLAASNTYSLKTQSAITVFTINNENDTAYDAFSANVSIFR